MSKEETKEEDEGYVTMDLLSASSWRYLESQKEVSQLKEDMLLPRETAAADSWASRMRCSLTLACALTRACMHRSVMFACFRTLCPLTKACSFTSPFKARSALLAFTTTPKPKSTLEPSLNSSRRRRT